MFPKKLYRNRTVYDGVTTAAVARIETDERFVRSEGEQIRAKAEGWVELSDLNQPVSRIFFRARAADAQRAEARPDRTWSEYVETRIVRSEGEKTLERVSEEAKAEGWVEEVQVAIDAAKRADRVAQAAATSAQREQQDQARHAADRHDVDLIAQAVSKALGRESPANHDQPLADLETEDGRRTAVAECVKNWNAESDVALTPTDFWHATPYDNRSTFGQWLKRGPAANRKADGVFRAVLRKSWADVKVLVLKRHPSN